MVDLLCTTCSAEKRRDEEPLPAVERYSDPRIHALARRARREKKPMAILSGRHGLLEPGEPIHWYDYALPASEVEALAPKIAAQLGERAVTRVIFYARPPETAGWGPYHEVIARACAAAGAELDTVDMRGELVGTRPELTNHLLDLVERDDRARSRLLAQGILFDGYAAEMETVHRDNARELARILDRHGWPGRSLVGREAAAAAWIIAQHAISLPDFQRRCRRFLERAVAAGEAEPEEHSRLVDRIRFNERRPQVYGTILDWDERGELSPWPIEDEESVDERRRRSGLPPLAAAVAAARRAARSEGETPRGSFERRQRRIDEWSRAVGWLPTESGHTRRGS